MYSAQKQKLDSTLAHLMAGRADPAWIRSTLRGVCTTEQVQPDQLPGLLSREAGHLLEPCSIDDLHALLLQARAAEWLNRFMNIPTPAAEIVQKMMAYSPMRIVALKATISVLSLLSVIISVSSLVAMGWITYNPHLLFDHFLEKRIGFGLLFFTTVSVSACLTFLIGCINQKRTIVHIDQGYDSLCAHVRDTIENIKNAIAYAAVRKEKAATGQHNGT
jgi:hypothetical protein